MGSTSIKPALGQNSSSTITASIGVSPSAPSETFVIQRIQDCLDFTTPPVDNYFIRYDGTTQKFVMAEVDVPDVGAAGSNTQIQFNSTGDFAGSSGLTWDNSTSLLAVTGKQTITSNSASAILMSIKQSASPTANAFQIKDSNDNVWFAAQSDKSLLIPRGTLDQDTQSLTWKTDSTAYGTTELRIQRNHSSNNGFGARLSLQDSGVTAHIKFQCNSFVQNYGDLEFHHPNGLRFSCPQAGGCYAYNGSAYSNGNEAALTIPSQLCFPGGGGSGYVFQSPFAIMQCTYGTTGVTKIDHLAGMYVEPPTYSGSTVPGKIWSINATGGIKSDGSIETWNGGSSAVAKIRSDGSIQLASIADGSASNSSLYYSTTQSKIVWKDASGVVNNLY